MSAGNRDHEPDFPREERNGQDEFREANLRHTLAYARSVHRRRKLGRGGVLVVAVSLMCAASMRYWSGTNHRPNSSPDRAGAIARPDAEPNPTVPDTNIQLLTDEQLFALLGDRPSALVGPPEHQRLILLDESEESMARSKE